MCSPTSNSALHFSHENEPFKFREPLDAELGITKLKLSLGTLGRRLNKLKEDALKTGSVAQDTANRCTVFVFLWHIARSG